MQYQHFYVLLFVLFSYGSNAQSTWKYLPNSPGMIGQEGRIDDVFFINKQEGWMASGGGNIWYTSNGGQNWTLQFSPTPKQYFRSIEFRNTQLGFAGTLDSAFYRSTNGGQTWTNIAPLIQPKPLAVCGISIPTDSTVYAVGQYSQIEPAHFLYSHDAGNNWIRKNMSLFAKGLVDILFLNRDTGWVSGVGINGGTILHTTDGGVNWTEVFNSGNSGEYVWKLQRVTPMVWVASIQTMVSGGRMVKSLDGGLTWFTTPAPVTDMQGIGFATPDHGWMGDYSNGFYETTDGGTTWIKKTFGSSFNRFFFIDSTFAYASGAQIYKFSPEISNSITPQSPSKQPFEWSISPNPTTGVVNVQFQLQRPDNFRCSVISMAGIELQEVLKLRLHEGEHNLSIQLGDLPSGQYQFLIQHNDGLHAKPFVLINK